MTRKNRILGLVSCKNGAMNKLLYIHSNAWGVPCVNGEPSTLLLRNAGDTAIVASDAENGACHTLVLPPGIAIPNGRFLAINSGEAMLWTDDEGVKVVNPGFVGVSSFFEVWRPIRAGVLTVSDKGSRGERVDTAGPALADMAVASGCEVLARDVVSDERETIASTLKRWCEEGLQLILATGGTGLSPRDVTPEALLDVSDRIVPGFGEIMRSRSMLYTKRGFLTRSIAVTRGGTLIISFPGSERAVRQCFEAIAPSLRHGVEILNGWDAECGAHA